MELMSQYNARIIYIKGEDNMVVDALSHLPCENTKEYAKQNTKHPYSYCKDEIPLVSCIYPNGLLTTLSVTCALAEGPEQNSVNTVLSITSDKRLLQQIKESYNTNPWCKKLCLAMQSWPDLQLKEGLWYVGMRLIIPRTGALREALFQLAHNSLVGFDKTYGSLCSAYYWPNMRRDLEKGYVTSCPEYQHNKSTTSKPIGPIHPLPILDQHGNSVTIDFIGPLPEDNGNNCIVTFMDHLGSDIQLVAMQMNINAEKLAYLFFDKWYCGNGLPADIVSDRDKLFISKFWKALHKLTGVKLKLSTAYHLQTDGASEITNKTINQCLCYHVERNQKGWSRVLPRICFHMMNTINMSTGFTPFQLWMGQSPQLIPPILPLHKDAAQEDISVHNIIHQLPHDVSDAKDNLLRAKISQSIEANKHHSLTFPFVIGSCIQLTMLHRRNKYKVKGKKRVAKFMPHYDGPYTIIDTDERHSTVTIELPNAPNIVIGELWVSRWRVVETTTGDWWT